MKKYLYLALVPLFALSLTHGQAQTVDGDGAQAITTASDGAHTHDTSAADGRSQELANRYNRLLTAVQDQAKEIEQLKAQLAAIEKAIPTEAVDLELLYVERRMNALASKHSADWAILYDRFPKTEGGTLKGRNQ